MCFVLLPARLVLGVPTKTRLDSHWCKEVQTPLALCRYQLGPPIMNSAEHGDELQLPRGCGTQATPCSGYAILSDTCL